MTCLRLAPDIHATARDEDLVVLDARGGSYFCLPGIAASVNLAAGSDRITLEDLELARLLSEAGLVTEAPPSVDVPRLAPPAQPSRDLMAERLPRASLAATLDAAVGLGVLARHYYGRPFSHLIATAHRPGRDPGALMRGSPDEALIQRLLVFRRLLPWAPFQGVCLYRSFFLLTHLRRAGFDALWVFGVQTWPFEAHCWLQLGEVVLDDTADRAAAYTPIMVV
jgi:hypothetical protein